MKAMLKQFSGLLLGFAPWIAFLLLAGHTLLSLDIAICISAALVVVMALLKLHRGAVLYAGYLFFAAALIFVVLLKNMWFIGHLDILANGTLLLAAMLGMIAGSPFTADYARSEVPPEAWETAGFIRSCYMTTSFWTLIFILNTGSGFVKRMDESIPDLYLTIFNYAMLICGVVATTAYSAVMRNRRENPTNPARAAR